MANPQPDKFIRVSTELLEALCRSTIPAAPRQVFDFIIRKTYGYRKIKDQLSATQIMTATGLCRKSVENSRRWLRKMCMMTTTTQGDSQILTYTIQKDYEKWLCYKKTKTTPKKGTTPKEGGELPPNKGLNYPQRRDPTIDNTIDNKKRDPGITEKQQPVDNLDDEVDNLKKLGFTKDTIRKHFLMRQIPEADIDNAMGKHF